MKLKSNINDTFGDYFLVRVGEEFETGDVQLAYTWINENKAVMVLEKNMETNLETR